MDTDENLDVHMSEPDSFSNPLEESKDAPSQNEVSNASDVNIQEQATNNVASGDKEEEFDAKELLEESVDKEKDK